MAEQIKSKPKLNDNFNDPNAHCQKEFAGGFICNEAADANVHHLRGATGYHEFVVGKLSATSAEERSSANGAESATDNGTATPVQRSNPESLVQESSSASSSTVSTEEQQESAQVAAGGSNE